MEAAQQIESDSETIAPAPYGCQFGLLSPDGKFYKVPDCGDHMTIYRKLIDAGLAPNGWWDDNGYLHLSNGRWTHFARLRPTQAQINAIFDWTLATGEFFPSWVKRFMEEAQ